MDVDWDLQAVVRGYAAATTTTTAATFGTMEANPPSWSTFEPRENDHFDVLFSDPFEGLFATSETSRSSGFEDPHDLFSVPFFPQITPPPPPPYISLSPQSISISPLLSPQSIPISSPPPPPQQQQQNPKPFVVVSKPVAATTSAQTPRSKRRKNVMKRVCHVPAEGLSSDMWSWRKYGQKPIKGSPYPRGYYRCSTSKGCLARKQVERNRSDPDMFIVTYTAEHNHPMPTHRNSLAGSTRQKNQTVTGTAGQTTKPTCTSPVSPADLSPVTEKEDDEDEMLDVSDMVVDDDFFVGLDDVPAGDCFSGDSPMSFPFPWLASNATTAAGGG